MKITSFNPLILTNDIENTVKLFEDLGFERHHTKDELDDREDIVGIRMMFEIAGVDEALAREAMRLAANKLPIKCKFVAKADQAKEGEQS